MKHLTLILFLFFSAQTFSQEFAPVGSIWYYDQASIQPGFTTYKTFEAVSDTMIDGESCKKVVESDRYTGEVKTITHFFCQKNDSVFYYDENSFKLLYDFGAAEGDTLLLGYSTSEGLPLKMIIDSVATLSVNGAQRTVQFITCGDGISIEFSGPVIQGIGSAYYMFPTHDNTNNGALRCYDDPESGVFKNPFYKGSEYPNECNFQTSSIKASSVGNFSIHPNPFSDYICISFSETNKLIHYNIIDVTGTELKSGYCSAEERIDLSALNKGIYFLIIEDKKQTVFETIVKR